MARKKPKTPALPVPAPVAPPLQPGDLVGSYRIIREIGAGGMGAVYEAEHIHIGKRAAIKVLLPELSGNKDAVTRFLNEARAASDLKHPRIVTVYDCAQRPNGQWFIALEYIEGGSLKRKMQSTGDALGVGEVVGIVAQVASALQAAHDCEKGRIIHRDIKPENILLSASKTNPNDDNVTVVDFGICKIDEARGGVGTQQGLALGTPNYMAPEYLRGDPADHRVDVYALGVVTWEMLTGQSLWGAGDQPPTKIHESQRTGARPLNPCVIKAHIPPELGAAVASALAFNPAERWPTVRAFALAVAHAVTSDWGETGMETLLRVARDLSVAPGDDSTAGRPMPPPLAPTLEIAVPVTPTRFPPGAVPIVALVPSGAPPAMPPEPVATVPRLTAHQATPAPTTGGPSRADALTVRVPGTVTSAVSVVSSTSANTAAEPVRVARQRQRRRLFVALGAAGIVGAVIAVVVATSTSQPKDTASAPQAPPAAPQAPATSAIAIVTEPAGATITVNGAARGAAPVNLAVMVGAEVEIRAELPGYAPTVQRAAVGAEPATVRVVLAALPITIAPPDAGAAAPILDAGRRKRPHAPPTTGAAIDPDGLVQP